MLVAAKLTLGLEESNDSIPPGLWLSRLHADRLETGVRLCRGVLFWSINSATQKASSCEVGKLAAAAAAVAAAVGHCNLLQVYQLFCTAPVRPICSFLQRVWRSRTSTSTVSHSSSSGWTGQHSIYNFVCVL